MSPCACVCVLQCFANQRDPIGVLMLCDVALGKQYERLQSEYEAGRSCSKAKCDSTFGKGKTAPDPKGEIAAPGLPNVKIPMGKGTGSGVQNSSLLYNEFIVSLRPPAPLLHVLVS